jgi:hypothetical protein
MGISRKLDTNFRMKINDKLVKQAEKCIHLGRAIGKVRERIKNNCKFYRTINGMLWNRQSQKQCKIKI